MPVARVDGAHPTAGDVIGIVGAGQLARMTCEAACALGVRTVVLAERRSDCAVAIATETVLGAPGDQGAMSALAERCPVVTFDHEQVDLDIVAGLEREGVHVRPGSATLRVAVDKAAMRDRLAAAGVPVPAYHVIDAVGAAATGIIEEFAGTNGWPVVVKAARGGYDGKGVWPLSGVEDARRVCDAAERAGIPLLVEEHVAIDAELAVTMARRPGGEAVVWPAVETTQVDGVCREVLFPGSLDGEVRARAASLARAVASVVDAVGVLAVEIFLSGDHLVVNEIASRPHNSGHWTIEGACTSQFENHVRAVLDLPLGDPAALFESVATVNVFGASIEPPGSPPGLGAALSDPGAHVHLYGKEPRPGRKLGHVTVCGSDPVDVRARAWAAAQAFGTPMPATLEVIGSR